MTHVYAFGSQQTATSENACKKIKQREHQFDNTCATFRKKALLVEHI